jgi:hypothetical protein
MRTLFTRYRVPPALGMTSLVLGHVALILAFLPILGVPLAAFGLVFGIVGLIVGWFSSTTSLRWGLAGLAACCIALGVTLALYYAPAGYLPGRLITQPWQPIPDRPFVPPPAPPEPW